MRLERKAIPTASEMSAMNEGLNSMSRELGLDPGSKPFCLILRDVDDRFIGGLTASASCGWLHIKTLWVSGELRGMGHGTRLVSEAEGIGRTLGCGYSRLSTFSYQAPGFYEKLGYTVFGELPDCPPGHSKLFLMKKLRT